MVSFTLRIDQQCSSYGVSIPAVPHTADFLVLASIIYCVSICHIDEHLSRDDVLRHLLPSAPRALLDTLYRSQRTHYHRPTPFRLLLQFYTVCDHVCLSRRAAEWASAPQRPRADKMSSEVATWGRSRSGGGAWELCGRNFQLGPEAESLMLRVPSGG